MPGTSKRTTSMSSGRASTNGWSSSSDAPMPLAITSGTLDAVDRLPDRGHASARRRRRRDRVSLLEDIRPRGGLPRLEPTAAQGASERSSIDQIAPPASQRSRSTTNRSWRSAVDGPPLGVGAWVVAGLEAGLRVVGRVDEGGDVPARRQHEPARAPEQLGALVARLPPAEVVGDARHDVAVGVDLGEVDRASRASSPRRA